MSDVRVMKNRTATIMFTDIYGFTQMSEFEGRQRLVEIVGGLHSLIESVVREFEGRVIKSIGDSLMVIFDSPTAAVLAVIEIQKRTRQRNDSLPATERVEIRIGLNTGEVTETDNDFYGESVNIASQVEGECEPGGVWFTEATYLALNHDRVEAIPVGVRALKGVSRRIKLFRIPAEQMNGAIFGSRTVSFFGMFQRDASEKPLRILPAPLPLRLKSGIIDFWISVVLVILIPLCLNSRPFLAWLSDAIRIEGENLAVREPLRCAPLRDMVVDLIGDLEGAVGYDSMSENSNVASVRFFSCHRGLILKGTQQYQTRFNGESGRYDVIVGYRFRVGRERVFNGKLIIRDFEFPFYRHLQDDETQRQVVTRGLSMSKGDLIMLESYEPSNDELDLDFIEFLPETSLAVRPFGIPLSSRFWEFYEMLDFDDRNVHFFLYRLPLSFFLTVLLSYLVFGRTPGNLITGCFVLNLKGTSVHVGQYLVRAIALLFVPIWGPFYLRQDRLFSDVISGTKVVVKRRAKG